MLPTTIPTQSSDQASLFFTFLEKNKLGRLRVPKCLMNNEM